MFPSYKNQSIDLQSGFYVMEALIVERLIRFSWECFENSQISSVNQLWGPAPALMEIINSRVIA